MSNTSKQVVFQRAGKGLAAGISNEELRNWSEKSWSHAVNVGNYDRSREALNFEVRRGGEVTPVDKTRSLTQRMAENLRSRGIKDPNEGLEEPRFRTVVNFIFGGSRDRMRQLAFGTQSVDFAHGADNSGIHREKDIERWALDIYQFVSSKYGEANIVSFIVHLDELNPHIHCALLPINERNKFAFKALFAGKDIYDYKRMTSQLHDELAAVNAKWGLERGTSVGLTGARHRSTEDYRRWLTEECTTLEEQLGNHRKALSDLLVEISIAEKKRKSFQTMVQNLCREKADIETKIAGLQTQLEARTDDRTALNEQIRALQEKLALTTQKLDDKSVKLEAASRQLDLLQKDLEEIQIEADDLNAKARQSEKNWSQNLAADLHAVMLEQVVNEFQPIQRQMEDADRALFDTTLVNELAHAGSQIITVTLQLMCGYVDDAVSFAQTHGGGGGGSDLAWGRDPKEDDREWARRCLAMARKMMHPGSGKQRKM
jgi:hypothetical protein